MIKRRSFLKNFGLAALGSGALLWLPRSARGTSTIQVINLLNNVAMLNSTWGRPVSLPSAWSKIRVGMLFHFDNLNAAPSGVPTLAFGLCSGTTAMMGDASATHFVGLTTSGAWSGGSCVSGIDEFINITVKPTVVVAGSQTLGTTLTSSWYASQVTTKTELLFCDITKGSPNYSFNMFANGGSCSAAQTVAQFLNNMAIASPTVGGYSYIGPQTMAVNEGTNGTLNAVNCWWNRADFALNIGALAIAVLA